MDETLHKGVLWEKVAELQLSERQLMESFDTEEDFINYMNRQPKIAWESVHGDSIEKIRAKAKEDPEEDEKPKAKSIADIKKKAKEMDDDEEDAD